MSDNLSVQYSCFDTGALFAPLSKREEILLWRGNDAANFLNNYNTQDIKKMKDFEVALGAFLTQKGKIVSDALILKLPDRFLLIFEKGFGSRVSQHLEVFLSFSSVEARPVDTEWHHAALLGKEASTVLGKVFADFSASAASIQAFTWREASCLVFKTDRLGREAWEMLVPANLAKALEEACLQAGASLSEEDLLEVFRVEAALPRVGIDMGEENLVAEVGLDRRATSFTKGCYLGQETTARVNTQGRVHKKLTLLTLEKRPLGDLPLEIASQGKPVGKITSLVESPQRGILGLGLVQTQVLESGSALELSGEPVEALPRH